MACSRGSPQISHLFFVDDSLLFCNATMEKCAVLLEKLRWYEKALGQSVNTDKTSLFFSRNTAENLRVAIQSNIGVPVIREHEKYLGLPSFVGRSKYQTFAQLKEKVWKKVNGWKEKLLSQVGKEILIKAVAQSMPTYTMNCFCCQKELSWSFKVLFANFGGVKKEKRDALTGWLGRGCASLSFMGDGVS